MNISEREITLKNGTTCLLRSPTEEDAASILTQLESAFGDSEFLTRYPEEMSLTLAEEVTYVQSIASHPHDFCIIAIIDGKLAGNIAIRTIREVFKMQHRSDLGITIGKEFWSMGLGTALIENALKQAKLNGLEQVELSVFSGNQRAIALYERLGFAHQGRVKNAFRFKDGSYQDEIIMQIFL